MAYLQTVLFAGTLTYVNIYNDWIHDAQNSIIIYI